ncbi:MAG: ABC transporter permease subunit [Chitinophagales bacterium]|jgi:Cu-processing system permease protein|nr:ABC transporter permease subunit [Chitinophagales bacterium]
MFKICKYVIYDILRSKVLIVYTVFLLVISFSLFALETDGAKSVVSLLSVVLIIVPLISVVFTTTYFYNAYEFIELLVAQPLGRNTILLGEFLGVAVSATTAFVIGVGLPVIIYAADATGFVLVLAGITLTLSFVALAFFASVAMRDKAKGIGMSLLLWFYFAVIYDAIVLAILFSFSDYPLDKAVIALASLNPMDMARIMVLMKLDISALMGFTGAVYKQFFGSSFGLLYTLLIMATWIIVPLLLSLKIFKVKNL